MSTVRSLHDRQVTRAVKLFPVVRTRRSIFSPLGCGYGAACAAIVAFVFVVVSVADMFEG